MSGKQYVFGFGSLVDLAALADYLERPPFGADEWVRCRLRGYRRAWNIARDNAVDSPGRGHFVCEVTGERLAVFVTGVNIRRAPGHAANGVVFRVDARALEVLDWREGSYDRIDVTEQIDSGPDGRVWAYRGKAEAEARFQSGLAQGTAVINQAYRDFVERAFAGHGAHFLTEYHATTDAPLIPARPLRRVLAP
jgi:hypothetical protein